MRCAAPLGAAACLTICLTACSFAPHYHVPETATANQYKESSDWKIAEPADASSRGDWWQVFQDADLSALETRATDANQSLKAAFARMIAGGA